MFVLKLRISPFSGNLIITNLIYINFKLFYFLNMVVGCNFNYPNVFLSIDIFRLKFEKIKQCLLFINNAFFSFQVESIKTI